MKGVGVDRAAIAGWGRTEQVSRHDILEINPDEVGEDLLGLLSPRGAGTGLVASPSSSKLAQGKGGRGD